MLVVLAREEVVVNIELVMELVVNVEVTRVGGVVEKVGIDTFVVCESRSEIVFGVALDVEELQLCSIKAF